MVSPQLIAISLTIWGCVNLNAWQKHLTDNVGEILFDQQQLQTRVMELAAEITADYQPLDIDELVVIGILRGSVLFMGDLIRQIQLPVTIDYMATSSYTRGTRTSGTVRILKDVNESITNKHVLVVEDIVDTGLTLECLGELLSARKPKSLKICTLLDKPSRRLVDIKVDYVGFSIPDKFVIGYGLDYQGHYRHLPYIGVLKPETYSK
jgi:hypoxanthine phosphoribosyltransferase